MQRKPRFFYVFLILLAPLLPACGEVLLVTTATLSAPLYVAKKTPGLKSALDDSTHIEKVKNLDSLQLRCDLKWEGDPSDRNAAILCAFPDNVRLTEGWSLVINGKRMEEGETLDGEVFQIWVKNTVSYTADVPLKYRDDMTIQLKNKDRIIWDEAIKVPQAIALGQPKLVEGGLQIPVDAPKELLPVKLNVSFKFEKTYQNGNSTYVGASRRYEGTHEVQKSGVARMSFEEFKGYEGQRPTFISPLQDVPLPLGAAFVPDIYDVLIETPYQSYRSVGSGGRIIVYVPQNHTLSGKICLGEVKKSFLSIFNGCE